MLTKLDVLSSRNRNGFLHPLGKELILFLVRDVHRCWWQIAVPTQLVMRTGESSRSGIKVWFGYRSITWRTSLVQGLPESRNEMFNFYFSNLKYCPGVCFRTFSKKKWPENTETQTCCFTVLVQPVCEIRCTFVAEFLIFPMQCFDTRVWSMMNLCKFHVPVQNTCFPCTISCPAVSQVEILQVGTLPPVCRHFLLP